MDQQSKWIAAGWWESTRHAVIVWRRLHWLLLLALLLWLKPAIAQAQAQPQNPATPDVGTAAPTTTQADAITELRRVKVSFFLNSISKIDNKHGAYTLDCYLDLYWFEPLLEGKRLEDVDLATLWNPSLEPVNSQDYQLQLIGYANSLEPRTNLRLSYRLVGTFYTKFDLNAFPFDRQTFTLQLESKEFDSTQLLFDFIETESPTLYGDQPIIYPAPRGKYLAPDFSIPEWTLENAQIVQFIRVLPYDKSSWAHFQVELTATRQWQGYFWRIFFQLFLVQLLFWAVLFIDSRNLSYRLLLLFTLFLVVVIFNLVLLQNLPYTAYLTLMERYMVLTYAAGALTALVTVVIHLFHQTGADNLIARIDALARWGYPVLLMGVNGLLFWYMLG